MTKITEKEITEKEINELAEIMARKPERRTLKNRKRDEKKLILSQEVAEEQLMRLLDFYEIYEEDLGSEAEKDALRTASNKVLIAIRKGLLTFNEDGTFIQTLESKTRNKKSNEKPTTIEYGILTGKAKTQNKFKKDESEDAMRTRRLYSMMGSLANMGSEDMMELSANDLSVMECVGFLLSTV
jgi:hypothetical protein